MYIGVPDWIATLLRSEPHISALSFVINTVHLFILTRRDMRNSATNVIMIGIAIVDIYCVGSPLVKFIFEKVHQAFTCESTDSYSIVYFSWIAESIRDDSRRCAIFLGLSMAIIRVLVIRNCSMKSSWKICEDMTGAAFGWKTIFWTLIVSSIISVAYHLRSTIGVLNKWTPAASWGCNVSEWPANYSQPAYALLASDLFAWNHSILSRIYLFVDGLISKILPTILFPILTVILIRQFRRVTANRDRLFSEKKKDRISLTTKLVIYMTISFMVSAMPVGILYVAQSLCPDFDCVWITGNLMFVTILLMAANSMTHFFICITVSTHYQNAVKAILGIENTSAQSAAMSSSGRKTTQQN